MLRAAKFRFSSVKNNFCVCKRKALELLFGAKFRNAASSVYTVQHSIHTHYYTWCLFNEAFFFTFSAGGCYFSMLFLLFLLLLSPPPLSVLLLLIGFLFISCDSSSSFFLLTQKLLQQQSIFGLPITLQNCNRHIYSGHECTVHTPYLKKKQHTNQQNIVVKCIIVLALRFRAHTF